MYDFLVFLMFVFFVFAVAMAKYSTIAPRFQHCGASAAVALAVAFE